MSKSADPQPPTPTVRELVARAMRGDKSAFELLHQRLDGGLRRMLAKRTSGQTELAAELAQRTWIDTWRALCEQRYDSSRAEFSTFLYAIGYKIWLQHRRQERGAAQNADDLDTFADRLMPGEDALATALHAGERIDALRACLRNTQPPFGLSSEERMILEALAQGGTERTLAAQLGLAASTIHARKIAALEKLRQCLSGKGFNEL